MPVLEFEISVKLDGQLLPRFPLVKRIQTTQALMLATQKAGGDGVGTYVVVPGADAIAALQAFALASDQPVLLRINGQSTANIALNSDGMLILIDGNINAGATTNLTINNVPATAANLTGFVAG